MTARKKGGAQAPLNPEPEWKPEPLDPEARWREFEARTATIAEAMRQALGLGPDVDMTRYAQRYAMAAMTGERSPPWPAAVPTQQAVKRQLLRVHRAAIAAQSGSPDARTRLGNAVKAMSREAQQKLPQALVVAGWTEAPAEVVAQLAITALRLAETIEPAPHTGGGRHTNHEETGFAALLLADFRSLTAAHLSAHPSAHRWDADRPADEAGSPYIRMVAAVFRAMGIRTSARGAAERAVAREHRGLGPIIDPGEMN